MSTSVKHNNFIHESMKEKPVTDLPGIGDVLSKRLIDEGFDKTDMILAQYLMFKKDKDLFQEWMKLICKANCKQSRDCYDAIDAWTTLNL